jgi:hypothetical protein
MVRLKRAENRPVDLAGMLAERFERVDQALPTSGMWADYLRTRDRSGAIARRLRAGDAVPFKGWQLKGLLPDVDGNGFYLVTRGECVALSREEFFTY